CSHPNSADRSPCLLLASHQASMIRHADAKASSQRDYLPPFFGLPTSSARRDEVGLQACSPSTPAAESSCECLMRLAVTPSAVSHTAELVLWLEVGESQERHIGMLSTQS
uniref:Uncharacterized protein n=1 Tax=Aegilops tauschii subsp. strangulata TaxID=200361 RepID=A0A453DXD8_AEGTS